MEKQELEYCCKYCGKTLVRVSEKDYHLNPNFYEAWITSYKKQHYDVCPAKNNIK